ncbi:unnamed protein product [Caenorhabditis sp. 36 PRJEB53466]|nr:unnamed protein product [Caenorhabditis sp. 36 PRJEB53466]
MLRPVIVDGLSFFSSLPGDNYPRSPRIFTDVLFEILIHFVLDGHKVQIFLPSHYEEDSKLKIDVPSNFQFLRRHDCVKFIQKKNRKLFVEEVARQAVKVCGILVSNDCEIVNTDLVVCRPVFRQCSDEKNDFLIAYVFDDREPFTTPTIITVESCREPDDHAIVTYRELAGTKRIYANDDNTEISKSTQQLLLKEQVFLVSSLATLVEHFAHFRQLL